MKIEGWQETERTQPESDGEKNESHRKNERVIDRTEKDRNDEKRKEKEK